MKPTKKTQLDIQKSSSYVDDVRNILRQARQRTYQAINSAMVEAYWLIGKRIVLQEQQGEKRATYGEFVLQELSKALTSEFGKGFSYANLKNFRQFYLTYPDDNEISYALRSQLTWTHHRLIMRVENIDARMFYLKECIEQQWSTRQLERNINTLAFQRTLSTKSERPEANNLLRIEDFIKDPYVFEFLNIPEPARFGEKEIEAGLVDNLKDFLLEMGKGFSFVGRQYRVSTETSHFYIDLVFYNYLLKCFVLIDLKTEKLTHQHIGQLDMYRRMFDDLIRPEGDNPTVGILLCTDKDETIVKYSVMNENKSLFASKYLIYLPTEEELIAEIEREKMRLNLMQK